MLGGGALDSAFEDLRTPKDAPRKLDWSSSSKVFLSLAASEFYGNAAAKFPSLTVINGDILLYCLDSASRSA